MGIEAFDVLIIISLINFNLVCGLYMKSMLCKAIRIIKKYLDEDN